MTKASSRWMQRGVEEEEELLSAQEVPPWHGEAVPMRPRRHQAWGRCRRHVGKTPHPTSTRSHPGEGRAARGRHGRDPRRRRRRSRGHTEAIDKISRTSRCAYAGSIDHDPSRRLTPAGAAGIERGGGKGDAVARARVRGGREVDASSGRVDLTEPPGRVRPGRPAPIGGPRPDRWG
jgi:hypothetical protein